MDWSSLLEEEKYTDPAGNDITAEIVTKLKEPGSKFSVCSLVLFPLVVKERKFADFRLKFEREGEKIERIHTYTQVHTRKKRERYRDRGYRKREGERDIEIDRARERDRKRERKTERVRDRERWRQSERQTKGEKQ